jgi:hypothetical protein
VSVRVRPGIVALGATCLVLGTMGCGEPTSEERIADTMRRTEDIRGLSAIEPVPYRVLPADAAFEDILDNWRETEEAHQALAEGLVLQRLGLLPIGYDILHSMEWSTRNGVLGYYDPEAENMTIVADPDDVGPGQLMVLAHEHAHALQDQHFNLESRDERVAGDEAVAFDALTEGEATLVMAVWANKRLGADGFAELESSDIPTDKAPIGGIPAVLERAGEFPYVDGLAFVFDRWGAGDWGAIDALWAAPPVSSEQIMHPERYPDDVPDRLELPDIAATLGAGWELAADLVMGEMQIGVLLADGEPWDYDNEAFAFPKLENAKAAEGWGGDRLLHLTGPSDDWAIVWQTTWDSAIDAIEFGSAAEETFEDLPFRSAVRLEEDATGGEHPHPVLILVTPDASTEAHVLGALRALTPAG